ncbi:MAG TPA: manganese efflux pump [Candidatus Elarobacter sp.]|nr:manganese efflux pump [Dongiaceae bacterium]HZW54037.1 manganese efflux pump [Candidatus Elarobacter sp.]
MSVAAFFKILFVALSLGLDVFAVSVGVGMKGTGRAVKIRIGAAFAVAEVSMTVIGVLLGQAAGKLLGDAAGYLGFAALVGVGGYMIYEALHGTEEGGGFDLSRGWGLTLGALSISLDSLGIGFSILYIGVPLVISLVFIGVTSIVSTTLGLMLGNRLGTVAEERAALWAGIVLVLTGLGFAALKFWHVGA